MQQIKEESSSAPSAEDTTTHSDTGTRTWYQVLNWIDHSIKLSFHPTVPGTEP